MKLDIDGKILKRLTITATLLLLITLSTWTSFLAPALAQVASASNSTASTSTGSTPTRQDSQIPTLNSTLALTGSFPAKPYEEIIGVKVTSDVYTYFPYVYANVNIEVTLKNFNNFTISENLPVLINGNETNVAVPVSLKAGEEKTFNTTATLWGGQPTLVANSIDYNITVLGVEKTVAVHSNRTFLLLFSIIIPIVIVIAYFAWKRTHM